MLVKAARQNAVFVLEAKIMNVKDVNRPQLNISFTLTPALKLVHQNSMEIQLLPRVNHAVLLATLVAQFQIVYLVNLDSFKMALPAMLALPIVLFAHHLPSVQVAKVALNQMLVEFVFVPMD